MRLGDYAGNVLSKNSSERSNVGMIIETSGIFLLVNKAPKIQYILRIIMSLGISIIILAENIKSKILVFMCYCVIVFLDYIFNCFQFVYTLSVMFCETALVIILVTAYTGNDTSFFELILSRNSDLGY